MIVYSNAKINIGLFVKDKRPDGYHNIESVFYPIPLNDLIEITHDQTDSFINTGIQINQNNNLILDAISLLRTDFDISPIRVHLHKQIPFGAGLGGGSSNASHTLKLLNSLFDLNLSDGDLASYALQLGSDCPFFILNEPALVTGRGENVDPIDFSLKGKFLLLAYPNLHISTEIAFSNLEEVRNEKNMAELISNELWITNVTNDFQKGLFSQHQDLLKIQEQLVASGAIYTSLSGTGSSIYGIFDMKPGIIVTENQWVLELN